MSVDAVSRVEAEAGLTERDTAVLKTVRLVWQRLLKLRQQAVNDDKFIGPYRDLLKKSLPQARARQTPEDVDAVRERAARFWTWYEEQSRLLQVAEYESRRGSPHMAWMAKWLPTEYSAFEEMVGKTVNDPSELHYEQAEAAATALLQAYIGAFTDH